MARTRKNAGGSGSEMLVLLAAAGVAVYGYMQGWFASLGFAPAAAAPSNSGSAPVSCPTGWTVSGNGCSLNAPLNGSLSRIPVGQVVSPAQALAYSQQSAAYAAASQANSNPGSTSGSGGTPALGSAVSTAAQVQAQVSANDPYIIPVQSAVNSIAGPAISAGYVNVNTSDAGTVFLRPDVSAAATAALPMASANWTLANIKTIIANTAGLSGLGQYLITRQGMWR
jgi:3D (Asp-Asp-Asp) domain-containing protein